MVRARTTVLQSLVASFLEALKPATDCAGIDAGSLGSRTDRPAQHHDTMNQAGSTHRGQPGIVVDVHGDLLFGYCVGKLSILRGVPVDNVLRDHS